MALPIDPNDTFKWSSITDRDKPDDVRPTFEFRYMSARDTKRVRKLFDSSTSDAVDPMEVIIQGIAIPLVGWRNVKGDDGKPRPFNVADIDAAMSEPVLLELRSGLLNDLWLSEWDKKKAAYALLAGRDNSASPTPPAAA